MDNRDFDNLFKNQLDGLPEKEFLFEDNSWDDVENILEVEGILPPVKRKWSGYLPFFLLGMLLLSNVLVSWKYYSAEQEITILNSTIQGLKSSKTLINSPIENEAKSTSSNNNNLEQTSTNLVDNEVEIKIVEKIVEKIVYVPVYSSRYSNNLNSPNRHNQSNSIDKNNSDTIDKNSSNISQTNLPNDISSSDKANVLNNSIVNNHLSENKIDNNKSTSTKNTNILRDEEKSKVDIIEVETISDLDLIPFTEIDNPIKQIHQTLEDIIDTTIYENKLKLKDRLARIGYAIEISNYELGISSGFDVFYQTTDFNSFSTKNGIIGEVTFSDNLKLGTTIDWKQTKGELDNIAQGNYSDDYFDDYPNLIGLNVDDELNKIEAIDKAIEFSVFAKYFIQSHHKWSPYFGFGIKGEYDYEQKFEYKYLDVVGYEYEMDYVYSYNKQLGFNTLLGLVGVQYKLSPNINVRFDAMYNYDYKAHRFDDSQMNWFSTNVGVLYKFK